MTGLEAKKKLKASGIRLKDIADTLNFSQQKLYSLFETKSMKIETLEVIAGAIGKTIDFFIGESESKADEIDYYKDGLKKEGKIELLEKQLKDAQSEIDELKAKLKNQSC